MGIQVANLLVSQQDSHQDSHQDSLQGSLQDSRARSLLHNQQGSRPLNHQWCLQHVQVASQLEFLLLNRPWYQPHVHLVNPVHNLVHNLRSHRQLRHLASLLLLHQANQLLNLAHILARNPHFDQQ